MNLSNNKIYPFLYFFIASTLAINVFAADLVIEKDAVFVVEKTQQVLSLDSLEIGDNAKIIFASDVDFWSVNAKYVNIGQNVFIDARGQAGKAGDDGISWNEKQDCGDGQEGGHGAQGENGSDGKSITLNLNIDSLGSLTIDASGGAGGKGGDGGRGEDAGYGKTCLRAHGGDGGDSGAGGNGGNGGAIRITIQSETNPNNVDNFLENISTLAKAGVGGFSGEAGEYGKGSPSQVSNIPLVTGGRRRNHAGKDGELGDLSDSGLDGHSGSVSITTQLSRKPLTNTNSSNGSETEIIDTNRDAEIKALKEQMEALQKRLEQLEE